MKSIPCLVTFAVSVSVLSSALSQAQSVGTEPTKCYERAWASTDNGGLGLTAGQAVLLCSGTTDASKTIQCYAKAWGHPNNGGLGLTAGQAVALCKTNSSQ